MPQDSFLLNIKQKIWNKFFLKTFIRFLEITISLNIKHLLPFAQLFSLLCAVCENVAQISCWIYVNSQLFVFFICFLCFVFGALKLTSICHAHSLYCMFLHLLLFNITIIAKKSEKNIIIFIIITIIFICFYWNCHTFVRMYYLDTSKLPLEVQEQVEKS